MAILQISIRDGFFVSTNHCYVTRFEPTHVIGNGWDCKIEANGVIQCDAALKYADGRHSMRYVILPNGFEKLTLKVEGEEETLREGFVIPNSEKLSNGILVLSGGDIDRRCAYFRDSTFQDFLDKCGITEVKYENPNQEFSGFSMYYGNQEIVWSDGNITWCHDDESGNREEHNQIHCNSTLYLGRVHRKVSNAMWTLVETCTDFDGELNYTRILYTLSNNVTELEASLMANPAIARYVHENELKKKSKK